MLRHAQPGCGGVMSLAEIPADRVTGEVLPVVHQRFALSAYEAKQWADGVRDLRQAVLRDGTDYAIIPGTTKPTLLKPGAEMLLLAAGFGSSTSQVRIDTDEDGKRLGVYYKTVIHRAHTGDVVAECEAYAGYDEDRFYQSAAAAEQKERANATKYKRSPNTSKFVEFRAPWNSVIKMCQKRSFVGAVLNATASSGLFTQDLEDDADRPGLWDATAVVKPHIDTLTPDQVQSLVAWVQAQRLPDLNALNAEQGARVLVKIGELRASAVISHVAEKGEKKRAEKAAPEPEPTDQLEAPFTP